MEVFGKRSKTDRTTPPARPGEESPADNNDSATAFALLREQLGAGAVGGDQGAHPKKSSSGNDLGKANRQVN